MWAEKKRSGNYVLYCSAQWVLRCGVGSRHRRRPLKPLEEHFPVLQKEQLSLLRIS